MLSSFIGFLLLIVGLYSVSFFTLLLDKPISISVSGLHKRTKEITLNILIFVLGFSFIFISLLVYLLFEFCGTVGLFCIKVILKLKQTWLGL